MDNTLLSTDVGSIKQSNNKFVSTAVSFLKTIAKIIVDFIMCFLVLITLLFLVVFIDTKINKIKGNEVSPLISSYVIVSPSMVPTIKVQDAVVVIRANADKLKKGDIITFKSNDSRYAGYIITHRINEVVKMDNGKIMFKTKGDNNDDIDSSLVPADNVYGKVIVKLPYIGFLQKILINPILFFLIIVLPSIFIIFYSIKKYINYRKTIKSQFIINKDENVIVQLIDDDSYNDRRILINENGSDIEIEII